MRPALVALLSGTLFGAGLAVAEMTNPAKVLAFLDFTGAWDPSLAFVMGTGLLVSALAAWLDRRRSAAAGRAPAGPPPGAVDARLVAGAAVFGLGWGLAGLCPGPAVAALVTGSAPVAVFAAAMLAGMALHRLVSAAGGAGRRSLPAAGGDA